MQVKKIGVANVSFVLIIFDSKSIILHEYLTDLVKPSLRRKDCNVPVKTSTTATRHNNTVV